VIPARVSFGGIMRLLLAHWMIIGVFAVVFAAASVAYALTRRPLFESTALLSPVKEDAGGMGALSGVIGQFAGIAGGLNLSLGGANEDEAIAVLESREFSLRFMHEHGVLPILYPNLWDEDHHAWKAAKPGKPPGPSLDNAVKAFDDLRVAVVDRRTEFVRLSIRAPTAAQAQEWAASMIHELNETLRQQTFEESQKAVALLSKSVETEQIQSIRVAAAALLESQLRREVATQSRRDYAMRVLDPPSLPDQRYYPKRTRMVIIGTGLGIVFGCLFVLSLRAWRNRR
jgi:uncharacterized protein involved in exopolysaccharide biosynthesis